MGRKDAMNSKAAPIDHYRKQIGKHDQRKDKQGPTQRRKHEKEMRNSAMSVRDVMLLLLCILSLVAGSYFILYLYLTPQPITEQAPPT